MVEPKPEQPSWRSITKASARGVPRTSSTFLPQCYAKLGDVTTIENTILCYDPKRMLSIKATAFPEGFEFVDAAKETWSIFYFAKVSDSKTKITVYPSAAYVESCSTFSQTGSDSTVSEIKFSRCATSPARKHEANSVGS